MSHLFDDEAVIEAVILAASNPVHDDGHTDTYYAGLLAVAVAALDREALIEKMVAHMATCDTFQQSWFHYRHHAVKALVDCGLIPDSLEGTR